MAYEIKDGQLINVSNFDKDAYEGLKNISLSGGAWNGGGSWGNQGPQTNFDRIMGALRNPYDISNQQDQFRDWQNKMYYAKNAGEGAKKDFLKGYAENQGWLSPQTPAASDVAAQPAQVKMDQGPFAGLRSLNAQIKYDAQGRPIRNDYLSMTDANGNLLDQFQMSKKIGADVNLNTQGLDEIRNRALSTGPSAWAQLAMEKQQQEEAQGINKANRGAQSAQNSAFSMLAGRGGLSAGQKERLAMQGQRQAFSGGQNARNTGLMNRLDIQMQDQKTKDQFLSQLPSQDMAKANFDQSQRAYRDSYINQDNSLGMKDIAGYNAYNANAFDSAMKEWGTSKTADAQAQAARSSSGGGGLFGGCFLTTASCEAMGLSDDCWVLETAREFRDKFMSETPERAAEIQSYYEDAPKIVESVNAKSDAKKIWKRLFWQFIIPFVQLVRVGKLEEAHAKYQLMIKQAQRLRG